MVFWLPLVAIAAGAMALLGDDEGENNTAAQNNTESKEDLEAKERAKEKEKARALTKEAKSTLVNLRKSDMVGATSQNEDISDNDNNKDNDDHDEA